MRLLYGSALLGALCSLLASPALAQPAASESPLTVRQIMQDPATWIGSLPSNPRWSEDGQTLYFDWNPQGLFEADSLYKVPRTGGTPEKVDPGERRNLGPIFDGWHHGEHVYDQGFHRKVYTRDGDLYYYNRGSAEELRLTDTREREANARFSRDGRSILFERGDNLFRFTIATGAVTQLTDLRSGTAPEEPDPDPQNAFLEAQQQELIAYLRKQKEEREAREQAQERDRAATDPPPTFYTGTKDVQQLRLDPSERFVTFALSEEPKDSKPTRLINYVTESGYAEEVSARPKVGSPSEMSLLFVQDLQRDTTYQVDLHTLPGAYDIPAYRREESAAVDSSVARRALYFYGPYWSPSGRYGVVEVRANDNKDRWLTRLDPVTGTLTPFDRHHDEAWIAGPGISWYGGESTVGWMPDDRHLYFQSERTGYSHLYAYDAETGRVQALTSGEFEVFDPRLSQDGMTWYFESSEESPFVRHLYRMPVMGGPRTKLTTMDGNNAVTLSPDGQIMAVLHSFTTQPTELYLQLPEGDPQRITHSTTEAWEAYPWRPGEIVHVPASDGVAVPAQVFMPENPNGAAVLFVHGAGYLQNVHRWWSSYFREYMFHNLLTDLGYVVVNADYRASAGYGRDWRTAIYRHMGGRDLQDYVDASRYVGERFSIDPERVFIYGGSYGGFITLMALFTEPEHFGGGAALRSVTDWAHYNHPYTANILNTPVEDSLAFAQSSPIHYAEGLEDPLLMAHGLLDDNVQPQDIIRLVQRLIELGKEDWELAVYPVEAHGFTEPESWADEYNRILKLIKLSVGPREAALEEIPILEGSSGG